MSFMIPLNRISDLSARTVTLIGIAGHRVRGVLALETGMQPPWPMSPVDSIGDVTELPTVRADDKGHAVAVAPFDEHDAERWDGLS